jgi:dolichol-phosphate mannosyltransferase
MDAARRAAADAPVGLRGRALRGPPSVSIVIPVFDERACLRELYGRLAAVGGPRELIFVDDGSGDGSFAVIAQLAAKDSAVRGLRLQRNCGSQVALLAGMRAARGEVVVTLDADLQHPPEKIPEMVAAWRKGHDVVEMVRRDAAQGLARGLLASMFYRAFNRLADVPVDPASTDFRLLDRGCVEALSDGWIRAAVAKLEGRRTALAFDVPQRFAGRSKYGLRKLAQVAFGALWSASRAPTPAPAPRIAETVGLGL